ncbi:MAG: hypothetical protein ACI8UZ_001801 [Akkermansiaceae bacterium]|jgi:hypothetical protein
MIKFHPILTALFFMVSGVQAFPPAPYYKLYGVVRDQVGQTITAEGASLILLKGAEEIGRTAIYSDLRIDLNYELKIRIDANRPATQLYNETAITAEGPFSLVVEMNGLLFYPIEVNGNLTAGKGGESVRLDLNLGVDSDDDGLPDTWEEWQLYQAGYFPDENGWDLSLIDRDGDFDKDGQSNWAEYVAGTFAGDRSDRFELAIKEKTEARVRFEFFAIVGKTYTIERSADGVTWSPAPFSLTETGERFAAQRAESVAIRSAYCDLALGESKQIYRMTVR